MRRNDFFKYLLLGGGGSASRSELESETLPYAFTSNSYKLRNYRIYGAEGGVGDLVTDESDEHYGKYCIPIRLEGKNILKNIAQSTSLITVNGDGSLTLNGTPTVNIFLALSDPIYDSDLILSGGITKAILRAYKNGTARYDNSSGQRDIQSLDGDIIQLRWTANVTMDNVKIYPMIRRADVFDGTFEPYQEPKTIRIYLDTPLEEGDYIDFRSQKRNGDDTSEIVRLPALQCVNGTNVVFVDTETQPSKIYLQGNISEIQAVSQSLQSSPQMLSLQPLDKSEFQLNDFSEIPVEDLSELEQGNTVDKTSVNELEQGNQVDKMSVNALELETIRGGESAE